MANITTTGASGYPAVLDTRTALTDGAAGDLVVANHPNGLGAAVLAIETELGTDPAGSAVDVKTRLAVALNNDGTVQSTVIAAGTGASVAYSSGVFTVSFSGDGPNFTQNIGLRIDVNAPVANQMRINLLQADLSTPTTTNPVRIAFRASTTTSGAYNTRTATTTTTMVVSGGSTLGFLPGELGRVYIGLVDNSGVPELCVWNSKLTVPATTSSVAARITQLYKPSEVDLQTTTAEGGAGGSDSAATLYSTTARSTVPIRAVGYMDIQTGASAGNWSNNPNTLQLIGPGVKTTGETVQSVATCSYGVTKTGATAIPNDGTIPQIGEGNAFLWATMTHVSPVNITRIESLMMMSNDTTDRLISHVHRNSEANALAMSVTDGDVNVVASTPLTVEVSTVSTGAIGYYMIGGSTSGTTTFNGEGGANRYADAAPSYMKITEVCA